MDTRGQWKEGKEQGEKLETIYNFFLRVHPSRDYITHK